MARFDKTTKITNEFNVQCYTVPYMDCKENLYLVMHQINLFIKILEDALDFIYFVSFGYKRFVIEVEDISRVESFFSVN